MEKYSLPRFVLISALFLLAAPKAHSIDLDTVKVELNGVFIKNPASEPRTPAAGAETFSMGLSANGLPSRYVIKVDRAQVKLETKDGTAVATTPRTEPVPLSSPGVPAVQAAMGDVRLFASQGEAFDIVPLCSLRADAVAKHWSAFLRFSATLDLQAAEYVIKDRLALESGALGVTGKVKRVVHTQDSVMVKIDEPDRLARDIMGTLGEVVYVLQNPSRKEALLGRPVFEFDPKSGGLKSDGWQFLNSDSPTGDLLTKEWLAGAEIAVLELQKVAAFTRSFSRDPLQLSFDIPGQRGKTSDYDGKSLGEIVLPANASKAQVLDYVKAILAVSKKQKTLGYEDPQVAMLMKVGPENLDVLLDAAPIPRTWKDIHLWKAMREIVSAKDEPYPGHKDLILSRLSANPDVAELLFFSWAEEARPILLKGIQDGRNDLSADWIEAIIGFRDPKTYPALTAYYLRNPTEPGLYERIRQIPGIDLQPIMPAAWETAKKGTIRQQSFVIHPACEWGVADALATAADWLRPAAGDYEHRVGRAVFKKFAPVQGSDAELVAWFDANKTSLVFDADKKMFLPR